MPEGLKLWDHPFREQSADIDPPVGRCERRQKMILKMDFLFPWHSKCGKIMIKKDNRNT